MAESSIFLESINMQMIQHRGTSKRLLQSTLNKKVGNHTIRYYFRSLLWRQSRIYPCQPMEQIALRSNHTSILFYTTYFIIWQPWSLLPFLFLIIIIWFFVSAVRQPLKHLARTAFLALLPNTEDTVWRWGSTDPRSGRRSGLEWSVWIDLNWSGRVYSACYLYSSLNLRSRCRQQERKGRIQVQKLEGCILKWWNKKTKNRTPYSGSILRNTRQKGKIRQLFSPSAGHNRRIFFFFLRRCWRVVRATIAPNCFGSLRSIIYVDVLKYSSQLDLRK